MTKADSKHKDMMCLLDEIALHHPKFPLDDIKHYVEHGEPTLALETLCDNLFELQFQLNHELQKKAIAACVTHKVQRDYWKQFEDDKQGEDPGGE